MSLEAGNIYKAEVTKIVLTASAKKKTPCIEVHSTTEGEECPVVNLYLTNSTSAYIRDKLDVLGFNFSGNLDELMALEAVPCPLEGNEFDIIIKEEEYPEHSNKWHKKADIVVSSSMAMPEDKKRELWKEAAKMLEDDVPF